MSDMMQMNEDKMHGLNGYVFTFANNQKHGGHYKLIYAKNSWAARTAMHAMHGDKWGFQYTLEEWTEFENDPNRCWDMETIIGTVYVYDGYMVGDDVNE